MTDTIMAIRDAASKPRTAVVAACFCACLSAGSAHADLTSFAVRLKPDGSIDTSFGKQGAAIATLAQAERATGDGIDMLAGNDKIVTSGEFHSSPTADALPLVGRLNADGTTDTSFGWFGVAPFGPA